jgi:hypothetical protein
MSDLSIEKLNVTIRTLRLDDKAFTKSRFMQLPQLAICQELHGNPVGYVLLDSVVHALVLEDGRLHRGEIQRSYTDRAIYDRVIRAGQVFL